jgi:hypothetical protein
MAMVVSANFFQTYGVEPALGRAFIPGTEDRDPGAHPVAVIGHGMWQSRFGGDPGVLGTTMLVNGTTFEVIGVSPQEFKGPVNFADVPIYLPLMMSNVLSPAFNQLEARDSNSMTAVARLLPGTTIERAQEGMDAMLLQLREEYPDSYENQMGTTMIPQNEAGIHPQFGAAQVGMSSGDRGIAVPGYEFAEGEPNSIHYTYVSEGYIETLGIDVIEGRTFQKTDDAEGPPTIIVNERFADRCSASSACSGSHSRQSGSMASWPTRSHSDGGK